MASSSVGGGPVTGAVVLFLVGAAFLGAAVRAWWARRTGAAWAPGRLTMGVDVLVGTVALADAASSVADLPARLRANHHV